VQELGAGKNQDQFGAGRSALVVEDDLAVMNLARLLLESQGFTVEVADTYPAAVARCTAREYDLVLTDKQLPGGSGVGLARLLFESHTDCEVVMMTAFADVESAVAALQLHVADYIIKPFRLQDALSRLRRVMQLQALKRRNRALVAQVRSMARDPDAQLVHDPLTHLFNHAALMRHLDEEIVRHGRDTRKLSIVLVGVDAFKHANESAGHAAGDQVLRVLADILGAGMMEEHGLLRGSRDVAARYGGDEFVLVLPEATRAQAAAKAEQVRAQVECYPFMASVGSVTVSAGAAEYPTDGAGRTELMHAADTALFAAKVLGRNRVVSFTPVLASLGLNRNVAVSAEMIQMLALDRSIKSRAFSFVYQPIVRAGTHAVIGYEGLCRPADTAFANPGEVFTCAERTGRIIELGRLMRELVVRPMTRLPSPWNLFVNLHPHELHDPALLENEACLDPWVDRVVLEITEVAAVRDYGRLRECIQQLRKRGFRIALDDLGSGYSGLNCLAQLDADYVKLDIGLLRNIHSESRSARLIEHILDFANAEDIQVIAEGVETEEECAVVTRLGCPLLQGYYFARPGPAFVDVVAPPGGPDAQWQAAPPTQTSPGGQHQARVVTAGGRR